MLESLFISRSSLLGPMERIPEASPRDEKQSWRSYHQEQE